VVLIADCSEYQVVFNSRTLLY